MWAINNQFNVCAFIKIIVIGSPLEHIICPVLVLNLTVALSMWDLIPIKSWLVFPWNLYHYCTGRHGMSCLAGPYYSSQSNGWTILMIGYSSGIILNYLSIIWPHVSNSFSFFSPLFLLVLPDFRLLGLCLLC